MNQYLLVGSVAVVAASVHRACILWLCRSWFRQGFSGDAAFHLAVVRELKKGSPYRGVPHFLIQDEPDAYPILFHRLAALLPITWVERWLFLPNALLWCGLCALSSVYAQYAADIIHGGKGVASGLYFLLFFLTLVSNVSSDMNGINYISLSERLLSRILTGLYFAASAVAVVHGDAVSFFLAAFAGAGALVSSMFARQAVVFTTLFVAVLLWNPQPTLILLASLALAALFDGAFFFRGVRQMVRFWHAYKNHTVRSRYYTLGHSKFLDFKKLLRGGIGIRQRVVEIESKEPTRLIFRFPELILFVSLAPWQRDQLQSVACGIVAATLVVYLLTTTRWFRHLGEAIRYVEYNLVVLIPLVLGIDFANGSVPSGAVTGYGAWVLLCVVLGIYLWSKFEFPSHDKLKSALETLNLQPHDTLFTVPFTLGSAVSARFGCRALMYQGSAVHLGLYKKFMEEIPYLKREWRPLALEYGVSHIIAEKSHLRATRELMGWEYDFASLPIVAETDFLIAYKVGSKER